MAGAHLRKASTRLTYTEREMRPMSDSSPMELPQIHTLLQDKNLGQVGNDSAGWHFRTHGADYVLAVEDGTVLHIHGRWWGTTKDDALFNRLRSLVARSNATRATPKAYLWPQGEAGHYGVKAEASMLTFKGVTEAQFYHFLETSFTAIAQFFSDVEKELPQLVTWEGSDA